MPCYLQEKPLGFNFGGGMCTGLSEPRCEPRPLALLLCVQIPMSLCHQLMAHVWNLWSQGT